MINKFVMEDYISLLIRLRDNDTFFIRRDPSTRTAVYSMSYYLILLWGMPSDSPHNQEVRFAEKVNIPIILARMLYTHMHIDGNHILYGMPEREITVNHVIHIFTNMLSFDYEQRENESSLDLKHRFVKHCQGEISRNPQVS